MASTLQRVLDLWRESERELAGQQPDSADGSALAAQIERLRRLYQRITIHEREEIRGMKGPDRTIVRSEWLATRSRAAASQAEDALQRSRTTRLQAESTSRHPATATAPAEGSEQVAATHS